MCAEANTIVLEKQFTTSWIYHLPHGYLLMKQKEQCKRKTGIGVKNWFRLIYLNKICIDHGFRCKNEFSWNLCLLFVSFLLDCFISFD